MNTIIYHNPRCSTSRNTLALLKEMGIEPTVIEYLKSPLSNEQLLRILKDSGLTAAELIRSKEPLFKELGLNLDNDHQEKLIQAMVDNPILVNRPIVITEKGVRLCRPIERVKEIL